MNGKRRSAASCLAPVWVALLSVAWGVPDFTFLHLSDVHFPYAAPQTRQTLAALPTSATVYLTPYGVAAPAPSFAIVTGDLNEFGGGDGCWEGYEALWRAAPFPVFQQLGNHDNTWDCGRPRLRRLYGQPFYAFERFGVKFIGWDSATPQDPRPSVATEGLLWLQTELRRTPPEQPVFFFCHHPPDGKEFAGDYERARLMDLLRAHNVALLLVGHGHGHRAWKIEGLDAVMGGSTFGERPGFSIVSVQGDVVRVCHQLLAPNPKMIGLLEKPLPRRPPFPTVTSVRPPDGTVFREDQPLRWTLRIDSPDTATAGRWTLDGERQGNLVQKAEAWTARVERNGLAPGAHTLRFELLLGEERLPGPTVAFWADGGPFRIQWKHDLAGSCQSTPVVADGRLYVGANDGGLCAFQAATGRILWRFMTGGEARSQPAVAADGQLVCFGSADGSLYALSPDGVLQWRFNVGSPIYASPLLVEDTVVCPASDGAIVAVEAATGRLLWRSQAADYAVESRPCQGDGAVFVGAWDRFVYALNLADGAARWRAPSRGTDNKGAVARYFSPADCAPAFAGGNVFAADRGYFLTVLDARTGQRRMAEERCVAVSASPDGRFVYVRHTDNRVSKRRADGSSIWTAEVPAGAVPTPPVEAMGHVWALSNLGVLSALDTKTGKVAAQYKAFPNLYAFSAPAFDAERVFLADMAGHLLALKPAWQGKAEATALEAVSKPRSRRNETAANLHFQGF